MQIKSNKKLNTFSTLVCAVTLALVAFTDKVQAQDYLPADNGIADYHVEPRWRESEEHPLRILGYIVHPFGWVAREVLFRPFSYFASSTETRRSVLGYREPFDYRQPECFSADSATPDCRVLKPYNYSRTNGAVNGSMVYFPDVNFDFASKKLSTAGKAKVKEIADIIASSKPVHVVLEGHTDDVGSTAYNEKLGMGRAEAVKMELSRLGVDTTAVSTVTFGETKPKAEGVTKEARATNRRVETKSQDSK